MKPETAGLRQKMGKINLLSFQLKRVASFHAFPVAISQTRRTSTGVNIHKKTSPATARGCLIQTGTGQGYGIRMTETRQHSFHY